MNPSKPKGLDLKPYKAKLVVVFKRASRLKVPAFILLVVILYGFLVFKINNYSGLQPSQDAVNSQVKAANVPHISSDVVQQLQSLQNNSVSVQALFDQARSNPFSSP
jgi:hypothetical protein